MKLVRNHWKKVLGVLVLALVVYFFIEFDLRSRFSHWFKHDVQRWLANNPILAPFVYFLVYVVSVVGFMPGSVITLAGGAIFGPILGTIYVSLASTTAAGIAFLIARYFASDWVQRKASGKISKVKEGIENEGWRFVALTRLVPIFPYTLLNYMFGLTKINFWVYAGVSWVAMLPGTFAYVYAGYAAKQAAAGGTDIKRTIITISIALGLLVFVSMIPRWIKQWRNNSTVQETDK
jgi:uncharacterized membrane protein YdjX (TVP38/TMEM64 family)